VLTYLVRRLFFAVFVLFGVLTVLFFILRVLPGDPAAIMLGAAADRAMVERQREIMGLDRPLPLQYVSYLGQVVTGDWGLSLHERRPAMTLVLQRLPATAELALAGMAVALLVGLVLGVTAALYPNTLLDRFISSLSLVGQAIPNFWLGILFILIFSRTLEWLPTYGRGTFAHLILPAGTLAVQLIGVITRLVRSGMLEVLATDYVRTARAKGAAERRVISHHAMKNMLIPVVTVLGVELGTLLAGAVVLETVFAWPGLGRLIVNAIDNRDYPVVQAGVTVVALIFVLLNLLVDLLYAYLDPRIRYT
jgi:peptide/nickel transport system permease protein